MGSIYGRLGYNFNTATFGGDDVLNQGVINLLGNTSIQLSQWQIDDIANTTVGGYYQNPHTTVLNNITIVMTQFVQTCNTSNVTFTFAAPQANAVFAAANSSLTTTSSFLEHTNRLSGVTTTPDASLYPDLGSALSVGRQMLLLTNKSDSVQNNTPILGNFTSLYVGEELNSRYSTVANDYIILNNSISVVESNLVSNISSATMNVILSDIQGLQSLMDTRRTLDTTFYTNSLAVSSDYSTVLVFSNLGQTQNSLIELIGTQKLKTRLGVSS